MGTIARMAVELGMDASGFERGIANVQNSLDSMAKKMASAGTTLSLGVTAPLAGIATMALQSAGDFEQSLNIMAQVSGATADQMATLEAQALNMGAVTAFSAGEAAQAQLELAKAGLSVNDIIAATPGVLDMAAAGGMGLAESAEIAANAMNAFNLPASEMPGIANMLAAAANASSVDITDLSAAMKMSGAVFASNKQPMDDMVTALAMLGNAGLKGSDAGTSLKTMMMSLAAPTDAAYMALTNMNVAAYDSAGNMRGFSDILSDLAIATAGMSDEQRNAALSTIFGADAIRAASILTRDYGKSWDGISDALGNGSAAADVANARMKGIAGAVEYFKGSLDSFLIGSALPYLDMVGNMIRSGADLITSFGSIPAPIQQAVIAFGTVLAAAGPVMLALAGVATALGFVLSPIGLVVVGVGLLAAAWTTNFGGIQEKTAAAWAAIQPTLQMLADWFQATLPVAITTGTAAFTTLWAQLSAVGATLQAFFAPAIERVQTAFLGLPESLAPLMPALQEMGAAFGGLVQAVQPLVMVLGVALAVAADFGVNLMAAAIERLPGIIGPIIDQVTNTIKLISTVLSEVTTAIVAVANGDWSTAWESMKSIVTAFQTFISDTWTNITTMVGNVGGAVGDAVVNTLNDMGLTAAATQVQAIIDQITLLGEKIAAVFTGDVSFAVEIPQWITEMTKWAWPDMPEWLSGLKWPDIPDWLSKWAWPGIPSWLSGWAWPGIPLWLSGWKWPGIPSWLSGWEWPAIEMPGWVQSFLDGIAFLNPFGGQKAAGGPVASGTTYMVGERGPELFTPNRSGSIIPNDELGGIWGDLAGAGTGGPQVVMENVHIYNEMDVHTVAYQVAAEIARWRR